MDNNNGIIVLDSYESALVYYAKGHYDKEIDAMYQLDKIRQEHSNKTELFVCALRNNYYLLQPTRKRMVYFTLNQVIKLSDKLRCLSNENKRDKIFNGVFFKTDDPNSDILQKDMLVYDKVNEVNCFICLNWIENILNVIRYELVFDTNDKTLIQLTEFDDNFITEYTNYILYEKYDMDNKG